MSSVIQNRPEFVDALLGNLYQQMGRGFNLKERASGMMQRQGEKGTKKPLLEASHSGLVTMLLCDMVNVSSKLKIRLALTYEKPILAPRLSATLTTKVVVKTYRKEEIDDDDDLPWFGQIVYLFEHFGKSLRVRWLYHGAETGIGEFAGPNELFLTNLCADNYLSSIYGKVEVDFIGPPATDDIVETSYTAVNHFFYRFHYDKGRTKYSDAEEFNAEISQDKPHCQCCIWKQEEEALEQAQIIATTGDGYPSAFEIKGIKYYLDDFVYIVPPKGSLVRSKYFPSSFPLCDVLGSDELQVFSPDTPFSKSDFSQSRDCSKYRC